MVTDIILSVHVIDETYLHYLRGCIGSIIENTPRDQFRLICVIDRGWDGTEQFLREYEAKGWVDLILRNEDQRGWTRTNNIGLEASDSDYAILLNMDTVVSARWLEGLVDCAKRNSAGVVGCKLVDAYGRINHAGAYGIGFHRGMNEENISYFSEEQVEWVTGACFLISQDVRNHIGNLDEHYPHWGSDREYCLTAREAGFSIWYSPITLLHYTEKSKSIENDEYFRDLPR